ncbi:type II toxin-antitoxin system RelE/ParE family toxin [Microbulbifer sp.]|uniref:type II toxin-antitoxin system RelE/ParE family toxin n=1 Tax=Microbulbifer sp. TaxID=1908541 RepID=UPI003F3B7BA5
MPWNIETTDEFIEWLHGLTSKAQEKVVQAIDWLEAEGPNLGRPRADTVSGSRLNNLKELRVSAGRHVFRIFYVFDPARNGYILCAGDKQGLNKRRFYRSMTKQAEALYAEYVEAPGETVDRLDRQ